MAKITPEIQKELDDLLIRRQQCRTDLWFLMKYILGYKDILPDVHGAMVDILPKFKGGYDEIKSNGTIEYTPATDLWSMDPDRYRIILFPRGHLKTSIVTEAGAIQWIINYPDIRILITSATSTLAQRVLKAIKSHFQYNPMFRYIFPEFCPTAKTVRDWGNLEAFTTAARKDHRLREPTCSTSSIGQTIAGSHYEVLLCSDMVDKENVKTPGAILEVIDHYKYMDPLLERHEVPAGSNLPTNGWVTIEGTRYDFGDLYGLLADEDKIAAVGAWKPVRPGIRKARWGDFLVLHGDAEADSEKKISLWPARFPWEQLKKMEADISMGPYIYSANMRNKPIPSSSGIASQDDLIGIWVPRMRLLELLPRLSQHVTVDLASMDERSRGDFIVLTLAGFDSDGRMYILDIRRGHFSELQVIHEFYDLFRMYPRIQDFKIEKEARWKTLEPFLRREQVKRGFLPPLIDIPRDNQQSKTSRIRALQPWFKSKLIRFADDLPCRVDLLQEITRFPSRNVHDDILDTLADQMQNRDGGVSYDIVPDPEPVLSGFTNNTFLEFDPLTKEATFLHDQFQTDPYYARMTGI